MDRRIVLAGLAAAFATPALAQTQSPMQATPQGTGAASGGAAGGLYSGGGQMGQAEMQHMQQTMMMGMVALETSKIALQKARNEMVKEFAQFEKDEQETISEVLRSMMEPTSTASTGAANQQQMQGGMPQMDAEGREMVQKMQQAQAGAAFDRDYVKGQIEGHQKLLQIQETYLKSNSRNREHMNTAKLARGHIKEHLARLEDIQQKLGRG